MKIRDRLSLQFTIISALLLFVLLSFIYFLMWRHMKTDFNERLLDRAITNAELFLAQDNLSEEKFKEVQTKYPQSLPEEIVQIYNDRYEPVFIHQNSYQWPKSIIDNVKRNKSIYYSTGDRQTVGIYYVDNSGNFTVMLSATNIFGVKQMRQLFLLMFISFLISVFIMFFTGRLFAKAALAPIIKVIDEVKFIRSSSLDKRLKTKPSKDEINELAITFNNLLEHLEQSFGAQNSFVAHASHELRTPITSIIGDIEVTLLQERSKEEYIVILKTVLSESVRLNDLLNSLFELTQSNIDIKAFENVRLDELLWQVKDEWSNKIPDSQIVLEYDLPSTPKKITIQGNNYLLFVALGNIVKNAIKFSNNNLVRCRLYMQGNEPTISIKDLGIGISPNDFTQIYQPFFRGENTHGYSGFGIGLSLAEKIFRLHDARISVHSVLNKGTEFVISFHNQ